MDPAISGVLVGGGIGAASALISQLVGHLLHERGRKADRKHERELRAAQEARRATPEFVEAVYSLKHPLDRIVSYYTGWLFTPEGVDPEEERERKITEAAKEFTTERVIALRAQAWQVKVALGGDAAGTAEEIVDRLEKCDAEFKKIQLWRQAKKETAVQEGGDEFQKLSKAIEVLLRRFAEQVRATTGHCDGSAESASSGAGMR